MPVEEDKRQGVGTFPLTSNIPRPPSGEASAGDESLQALWLLFVKIQPSLTSLLQDLTKWHASKIQGPSSHFPQEIKLGPGEPSSDMPKETPSDGGKPILDVPQVIGSNAAEPSLSIHQQTGLDAGEPSCNKSQEAGSNAEKQSADIHKELGSDTKQLKSNAPQETCPNTENPSPYIPQEIGLEAEKPSLGQTSLGLIMHQEIGLGGRTSEQVSLQIDDEQRSSIETYEKKEEAPLYMRVCLFKAALIGDWSVAKSILQKYPHAVRTPISKDGDVALHIAVLGNHTTFATELMKLMQPEDLMLKEVHGLTAFHYAAGSGNVNCAKKMVQMNDKLPLIRDKHKDLPIHFAAQMGQKNMVQYLILDTSFERVKLLDKMDLLTHTISTDMYDIGLDILRKDSTLATASDSYRKRAFEYLAEKPLAIDRTREVPLWKRYLCFGLKEAYNKAPMQTFARQLVEELCREVQRLPQELFWKQVDKQLFAFHTAARLGNIEFLTIILCSYPELIWIEDKNGLNILQVAILERQESIFNLIYEIGGLKDLMAIQLDRKENNLLHLVAHLAPSGRLNIISGAAFQMQRELMWFKEIEKIVPPTIGKSKNLEDQTAHDIFTKEHKQLCKDGEKWMKTTANNCMIVATLIATVVFAASVTIPGGNNQANGIPIFLESNWFLVFFVSNAIALLSSSTSILIFLSILTSRYMEEDFLKLLPRRLVFGFTALFISIVGMLLAFSAICFLVHQSKLTWIPFLIIASAGVPVIMFILLHYDLWLDVIWSAYGSKFLFRPRKHGLFQGMKDDLKKILQEKEG